MEYRLYTLVDITHTGQYRYDPNKIKEHRQEQNFNTVIQTIGLRSNIIFFSSPIMFEVRGSLVGFDTDDIIRVWRFDFRTEQDDIYMCNNDPVWYLKEDFMLVPYISGLDELIQQNYDVFVSDGPTRNITFIKR